MFTFAAHLHVFCCCTSVCKFRFSHHVPGGWLSSFEGFSGAGDSKCSREHCPMSVWGYPSSGVRARFCAVCRFQTSGTLLVVQTSGKTRSGNCLKEPSKGPARLKHFAEHCGTQAFPGYIVFSSPCLQEFGAKSSRFSRGGYHRIRQDILMSRPN